METVISNNWNQNYPFLLNELHLDKFKFTFKLNPFFSQVPQVSGSPHYPPCK